MMVETNTQPSMPKRRTARDETLRFATLADRAIALGNLKLAADCIALTYEAAEGGCHDAIVPGDVLPLPAVDEVAAFATVY